MSDPLPPKQEYHRRKDKPLRRTRCQAAGASVPVGVSKMNHLHIFSLLKKEGLFRHIHLSALNIELLEKVE